MTWFEEVFLGEFNLFVRYSNRDEVFRTIIIYSRKRKDDDRDGKGDIAAQIA